MTAHAPSLAPVNAPNPVAATGNAAALTAARHAATAAKHGLSVLQSQPRLPLPNKQLDLLLLRFNMDYHCFYTNMNFPCFQTN